jgi:hypothetical protein
VYEIELHTDESIDQFEHDSSFLRLDQLRVQLSPSLSVLSIEWEREGGTNGFEIGTDDTIDVREKFGGDVRTGE